MPNVCIWIFTEKKFTLFLYSFELSWPDNHFKSTLCLKTYKLHIKNNLTVLLITYIVSTFFSIHENNICMYLTIVKTYDENDL